MPIEHFKARSRMTHRAAHARAPPGDDPPPPARGRGDRLRARRLPRCVARRRRRDRRASRRARCTRTSRARTTCSSRCFDDRLEREVADMQRVLARSGRRRRSGRAVARASQGVIERRGTTSGPRSTSSSCSTRSATRRRAEKLAASVRREYEMTRSRMLEDVVRAASAACPTSRCPCWRRSRSRCSTVSRSAGSSIPRAYTQETITEVLTFLYDTIGVEPARRCRGVAPRRLSRCC